MSPSTQCKAHAIQNQDTHPHALGTVEYAIHLYSRGHSYIHYLIDAGGTSKAGACCSAVSF